MHGSPSRAWPSPLAHAGARAGALLEPPTGLPSARPAGRGGVRPWVPQPALQPWPRAVAAVPACQSVGRGRPHPQAVPGGLGGTAGSRVLGWELAGGGTDRPVRLWKGGGKLRVCCCSRPESGAETPAVELSLRKSGCHTSGAMGSGISDQRLAPRTRGRSLVMDAGTLLGL